MFANWRDLLAGKTEHYKAWLQPEIRSLLKVRDHSISQCHFKSRACLSW